MDTRVIRGSVLDIINNALRSIPALINYFQKYQIIFQKEKNFLRHCFFL